LATEAHLAGRKQNPHLYELAKLGAQARLQDLIHEAKLLIDLFPHLRDSYDPDELPSKFLLRRGRDRADAKARKRKKPQWTAEQHEAVAARIKKYWATRKKSE
jgi:hypothetical protein